METKLLYKFKDYYLKSSKLTIRLGYCPVVDSILHIVHWKIITISLLKSMKMWLYVLCNAHAQ